MPLVGTLQVVCGVAVDLVVVVAVDLVVATDSVVAFDLFVPVLSVLAAEVVLAKRSAGAQRRGQEIDARQGRDGRVFGWLDAQHE